MPRISDQFLECVIYLYPSTQAAQKGERVGGSGLIVGVPTEEIEGKQFTYAVSNRHVVLEGSSPVIRVNKRGGGFDIIDVDQEMWIPHPEDADVAICLVGFNSNFHKFKSASTDYLITPEIICAEDLGPGDDIFMVGRFIDHEGIQHNQPSVRFGNISMMPGDPLPSDFGSSQESFIVEMRSVCGYSGSPVFAQILPYSTRSQKVGHAHSGKGPWLLGIDWGHVFDKEPLRNKYNKPMPDGQYVRANSGMVGVVPAWRISEMLFDEKEIVRRGVIEAAALSKEASATTGFALDVAAPTQEPPATDENPQGKEDFNSLLDAAVSGSKPSPETS